MIPYWALWSFFLGGMLTSTRREGLPVLGAGLTAGLLLILVMVGLRFEVGGDWFNYQRIFDWTRSANVDRIIERGDIGYGLTNLLAVELGAEVWLVNSLCAAIFVFGLARLVRLQPEPWACLLVAIPYLVVVVAMGYTRQSAAIGCLMSGLASLLQRGSVLRFAGWIIVGALFHKTVVIAFPLIAFVSQQNRLVNALLVASATVALYFAFVDDSADTLVRNYLTARYASSGALIRVSMCVVPAIAFFLFRKQLDFGEMEDRLWRNFSLAALSCALLLLVSASSTAVDRIALYLLPLQLIVIARISGTLLERTTGHLLVAAYSGAVLFTWLNFGVFSREWLPYLFWPLA